MVDGVKNLYNEYGQVQNDDVARTMAEATQKGYLEADKIEAAAKYSTDRLLTPEQHEWQEIMDDHIAKRPHEWDDVRYKDGARIIFAKIPKGYQPEISSGIVTLAITEKGFVAIAPSRMAIDAGMCEDWTQEIPEFLWKINQAHSTDTSAIMTWKEAIRKYPDQRTLTNYIPIHQATVQEYVKKLKIDSLLDQGEAFFTKKQTQEKQASPLRSQAAF